MKYVHPRTLLIPLVLTVALLAACSSDNQAEQTAAEPERPSHTIIAQDSISALDLVVAEHDVVYTSSNMGAFVKEIDSIAGGSEGYWMYKVNDTMVPVASDKMILNPGDTLTWFLYQPGE